jgi:hypothetical protein
MRGPGRTRRFSGQDYGLSSSLRAAEIAEDGSVKELYTYEQRNNLARQRALTLRNQGLRARVVNGSGWTAIYVAGGVSGVSKQSVEATKKVLEENGMPSIPKKRKITTGAQILGGLKWGPLLGVDDIKMPGMPESVPVQSLSADIKEMQALSQLMQTYKDDFSSKTGMALIGSKKPDAMEITDARFVDGEELVDVLNSLPTSASKATFNQWLLATGAVGDAKYQNNEASKNMMQRLALVMLGRNTPNLENLKGIKLYMVFENENPVYWQFADGEIGSRMQKQRSKPKPGFQEVKSGEIATGWADFQLDNA